MRVLVYSGNPGKLAELRLGLRLEGLELVSGMEMDEPEESGESFEENALIKARHARKESGLPAIAEDSGLMVDALEGRPGVRSRRFAGERASDQENLEKLLREMEGTKGKKRKARMVSVLAFCEDHKKPESCVLARGEWCGQIAEQPMGKGGFGYDPVFWLPELGKTAAELGIEKKNRLSHRARAIRVLEAEIRKILAQASGRQPPSL